MESKFTPAPWDWHWRHENGEANGTVFSERTKGHAYAVAICPRYQTREQWEADARLIAAAPSMLDALRGALVVIETIGIPEEAGPKVCAILQQKRAAIFSAISRAEGN